MQGRERAGGEGIGAGGEEVQLFYRPWEMSAPVILRLLRRLCSFLDLSISVLGVSLSHSSNLVWVDSFWWGQMRGRRPFKLFFSFSEISCTVSRVEG